MFKMSRRKINSDFKVIILSALIVAIGIMVIVVKFTNNVGDSNHETPKDYDGCTCLERNNWKCPDGFHLLGEERVCIRAGNKTVTNVLLGCSKYDCNGTVYEVND